jgi:filamentous hemagglutinin family protein
MNTPFPPFSQKLLVMTLSVALGIDFSSVANAVSVITMDGTTGTAGAVTIPATGAIPNVTTGPTYTIGATNGTQNGSNLFFSFSNFGIAAGDTALFQCPGGCAGVTNVISRVTGGVSIGVLTAANPSNLLGTLTSTIGTANFWFFNPNGVGISGVINVPVSASYFISNANSLGFSDGTAFRTGNPIPVPPASTLSAATPTAFGFPTTQAVSTVPPPAALNPATSAGACTPYTITYPSPIIITGINTPPTPILTPVSTPVSTPVPPVSTSTVVIEAPPLRISPQGDISMVVATQPVLTVAIPPLPKSMNPCDSDGQSTLISKGVANYVPQASSQIPQSIVETTTGVTPLASIEQTLASTSNEESDDCL